MARYELTVARPASVRLRPRTIARWYREGRREYPVEVGPVSRVAGVASPQFVPLLLLVTWLVVLFDR